MLRICHFTWRIMVLSSIIATDSSFVLLGRQALGYKNVEPNLRMDNQPPTFLRRGSTRILLSLALATGLAFIQSAGHAIAKEYKMPDGTPFDADPEATNSETNKVLVYGTDPAGVKVPLKTVRITNNSDDMVFLVMRDPNSNETTQKPVVGLYNPFDEPNKEYRGYIGYKGDDGQYYFGLKPGESIKVPVPLVFWNGCRMGIGTDGDYLVVEPEPGKTLPNPLRWNANAKRVITASIPDGDSISNGVVMWYKAPGVAEAPNDDTEDQLVEWTIRDHDYLSKKHIQELTHGEIPDNELVTLINYDVSNVDNLYLPVAMAATDAWLFPQSGGNKPGSEAHPNRDGWEPGSDPEPYGWTGSTDSIEFLQKHIREFTADNNKLLGAYFEGNKGWPYYNIPNHGDADAPIKIPSGANIFAQSPILGVPSSYGDGDWANDKYMLSSGGTKPVKAGTGNAAKVDPKGSTTLHLNDADDRIDEVMAFIQPGYYVVGLPGDDKPEGISPIAEGTTVKSVNKADRSVELSKPLLASSVSTSYDFVRPTRDYAAERMIQLFYSWAQYYRNNWKQPNPEAPTAQVSIKGSMDQRSAFINFNEPHPELVPGMAVRGPGLDDAMTEKGMHQGDAVILEIASDKKSVMVSQVARSASNNANYTFLPPQELLYTPKKPGDPGYPLIQFSFKEKRPGQDPYEFSQAVYLAMASMNQIGEPNNNNICKFMQDIVGANMGFIFDQPAKDSDDGKMLMAHIRDIIKSILRGVSDFTKYGDVVDAQGNHLQWYPDPKEPRGGQPYNVFNLDPFVWFVHVQLGFSGYGFSIDDDTADVGAGGANNLQVSVTGKGGLPNKAEWSIQAPFGPVKGVRSEYSGPDKGDTLRYSIKDASNTTPIVITSDGQHRLKNGDIVTIEEVMGNTAANGTFKVQHAAKYSFELVDSETGEPIAGNGQYTNKPTPGLFYSPKLPYIDTGSDLGKVFYRVTGDDALDTFEGTSVEVDDLKMKEGQEVRVKYLGQRDVGRLILSEPLLKADGQPLPAGTYTFSYYGDGQ